MKQSKLRRRRVIRFAIVYFVLLVVFIALVAGPVYAGKAGLIDKFSDKLNVGNFRLFQNPKIGHNDTSASLETGAFRAGKNTGGAGDSASSTDGAGAKIRLF